MYDSQTQNLSGRSASDEGLITSVWPGPGSDGTHPLRIPLAGEVFPGHEAQLVRDDNHPFALIGRWAGGGALVGSEPIHLATKGEDPFALLDFKQADSDHRLSSFVGGGWFGYLGFELGVPGEAPIPGPPSREQVPEFKLARYDHLLRLDSSGQWSFEAIWTADRDLILRDRFETFRRRLESGIEEPGEFNTEDWRSDPSSAGHAKAVQACRERIKAGDLYQANISMRLRSSLQGDPVDLFSKAAAELRPDRAAYLTDGLTTIASLSPELFLERKGNQIRSAPIKGTRPRAKDHEAAEAARLELAGSKKDLAENTMIVDLVRNDLGRVCEPGSVRIAALAEPRAHPGVWHLVSEVEGTLRPDTDNSELLAGSFPPGSVTGAPKLAAIEVIAELESNARQVFTGAIGFSSPFAGLELSVAIRTFEISGDQIWLDAGGGIVADSDPEEEATEAATKARPLLDSIGGNRAGTIEFSETPAVLRLSPRAMSRPDPAEGVFETLLVSEGRPVNLTAHLSRLQQSVAKLYGEELPSDLAQVIDERASEATGENRLRIDFLPDLGCQTGFSPLVEAAVPLVLAPTTVPGGLGAHKWRDRRLIDELTSAVAPAVPLLVDLDGHVLEAAWASVFMRTIDGELATPPLDGRILPSVGRKEFIADSRLDGISLIERPILLDELRAASEVFILNSLRGSLPAVIASHS